MNNEGLVSRFVRRGISRRSLVQGTMGSAGAVLASGLWTPARADDDNTRRCGVPLPIRHITTPPGQHFYFPGPIDGSASPSDPSGTHAEGRDPSTITNFSGFVGQIEMFFSGTGTDLKTGTKKPYGFHTDTRFMKGEFIASDQTRHKGAFAFI